MKIRNVNPNFHESILLPRCSHRREEVVLGEGTVVEVLEGAAPLEEVSEVAAEEAGNREARNWLCP